MTLEAATDAIRKAIKLGEFRMDPLAPRDLLETWFSSSIIGFNEAEAREALGNLLYTGEVVMDEDRTLHYGEKVVLANEIPKPASLDEDEEEVMRHLLTSYQRILGWGLQANTGELESAVHVIQGFIIQHMLGRVNPEGWSQWFDGGSSDI